MAKSRLDEWLSNWPIGFQKAQELSEAWERQQRESAISTVPSKAMTNYLHWRSEFEAEHTDGIAKLKAEPQVLAERNDTTGNHIRNDRAPYDISDDDIADSDNMQRRVDSGERKDMSVPGLLAPGRTQHVWGVSGQYKSDKCTGSKAGRIEETAREAEQRTTMEAPDAHDLDTDDDSEECDEGPGMESGLRPQQGDAHESAQKELEKAFEQEKMRAEEERRRREATPAARARAILRVATITARSISQMQQNIKAKQIEIRNLKHKMAAAQRDSDESTLTMTQRELKDQISELLVMKVAERRKAQSLSLKSTCPTRNSTAVVLSTKAHASTTL